MLSLFLLCVCINLKDSIPLSLIKCFFTIKSKTLVGLFYTLSKTIIQFFLYLLYLHTIHIQIGDNQFYLYKILFSALA